MPRNYFLINLIFILIIGLLGVRFYKVWVQPLHIPVRTVQSKDRIIRKSTERRRGKIPSEASYEIISQKNLFRPSRSPVPDDSSFTQVPSREKPKLFGTMIMDGENVAILEDPASKDTKLYYLNDSIGGFTVSEIHKDKVILKRGETTIEVKLREDKGIRAPKPRATNKSRLPRASRSRRSIERANRARSMTARPR